MFFIFFLVETRESRAERARWWKSESDDMYHVWSKELVSVIGRSAWRELVKTKSERESIKVWSKEKCK